MLFFGIATALLSLFSLTAANLLAEKRATKSGVTLYVYGGGSNGSPIFYADGLAYFGDNSSGLNASTMTDITFTVDTSSTTVGWTAQSNSTTTSFNQTETLYILPSSTTMQQVGFSSASSTAPSGAVTTGFTFFGTSVAYEGSNSIELSFWGVSTASNNTFGLYWKGTDSTALDDSFPVTIKTTAPVNPSRGNSQN